MAATLKQIAALTGLSIPTVHQILNKYDAPFAEATRKKVLAVAAELNYRPNITARSLVSQRSFLIGVLFYGPNYPIATRFMRGVQQAVLAQGCSPIFLTHESKTEEAENLRSVQDRRVDGLLVNTAVDADGTTNAAQLAEVRKGGLPVVEVFGRFIQGVPAVTLDYRAAARVATERLVAEGHSRIALLIREQYTDDDPNRVGGRFWIANEFWHGYLDVMRAAGLAPSVHDYPVPSAREGAHFLGAVEAIARSFADPARAPTAVVCYSVEGAEAAVRFCERLDGHADRPVSIAAFGDLRPTRSDRVHILRLPFPAEEAGRLAAGALFDQMANRDVGDVSLGPVAEAS
jgi:LacI family transcriptional regulator